ncbi:hypothetical protein Phou_026250 [Phytohabitans houttuyneae]|uniref:Uncharacterized protein n=1 Tax=Phytohabitans houttuyneae TaxID=1076126 RepID=A0A6V8KCG6_9ACTN|nr:hypothetical protein Phou_026250 [Phytohabitans houttuyneae]
MTSARERPTLEEVARRAGVSRATVSRVVNGSTTVALPIQEAVRRAVRELGYVPNLAARTLVTQRTDSIALVLPETATRVFSDDPLFPGIVRGVSQELEAADRQLVLMMAGSAASHDRIERYAMGRHVDGVMFASMHGMDPLPGALARIGMPSVCSGRPLGRAAVPYVDIDHLAGVASAVRHLLDAGRQRIATIAGPQDMVAGIERLAGYRDALRGSDRRSIVAVGDFTRESGAVAMRHLLDDDPKLDAVFVASDLMADGALRTLREAGRRVPDDVAVIGFDDAEFASYTDPRSPRCASRSSRSAARWCGSSCDSPKVNRSKTPSSCRRTWWSGTAHEDAAGPEPGGVLFTRIRYQQVGVVLQRRPAAATTMARAWLSVAPVWIRRRASTSPCRTTAWNWTAPFRFSLIRTAPSPAKSVPTTVRVARRFGSPMMSTVVQLGRTSRRSSMCRAAHVGAYRLTCSRTYRSSSRLTLRLRLATRWSSAVV